MKPRLRRAFRHEMDLARLAYQEGDWQAAFRHLERAHIIGQRFIGPHTLAHWWMLRVGWRRRDAREVRGQLPRLVAALLLSRIWVPAGNTGSADVSPIKPMPIPADLVALLRRR
ncbi:MAG: DUF3703 domain-containing protein [Alloalcanivorax venustensis]|jgi:hypothetical protein|uniref:DUF3703 domain-containing protein n=1 Tax=Alloalcanivorax gelatiniphagus TaxID=1194167 RepID=A0ABY2XHN0_9GAMM|nr:MULTISPECIES: DUF3703 domain-containing protein [Alloalcanivorax]MAD71611.1 hypothetical protein [Alcanivorax sp.]MCH9784584.1 DUF3703 domain-containing protein [Gammaproteobacteria bacterium]MCQ6260661.1 DUF3703 domain-containing protein [Alcanivorax sp. MM125-6]QJX02722.1 DUF3703 domain-containing protein [Alcanivorax sp. IO_7]SMO38119.1 Protein of unknown function [Alcanivorax sp. DSM 26295]|tara:strand:- start:1270 stop:1611 length:342 start_codon:yes stop_codon:yes gene_type:complete